MEQTETLVFSRWNWSQVSCDCLYLLDQLDQLDQLDLEGQCSRGEDGFEVRVWGVQLPF